MKELVNHPDIDPNVEMYLSFDFGRLFKALKQYIDRYNEEHPKLTEKLNAGHRATAEFMLRNYIKQLNHVAGTLPYSLNDIPPFRTYVSSIATFKGCTPRTVYNHKKRLLEANLITKENHHGGDGLDLWITKEILWEGVYLVQTLPEGGMQHTPISHLLKQDRKNVPPLAPVLQEHTNNNSSVDKEKGVRLLANKCGLPGGNAFTGAFYKSTRKNASSVVAPQPEDAETTALKLKKEKKQVAEAAKLPEKMPQPCPEEEQQEQQVGGAGRIFHKSLVLAFWDTAKRVLYPNRKFKEYEDKHILNLIWYSVYNGFRKDLSKEDRLKYHDIAIERILMVRRYLDRTPGRWIPDPELYFYRHNTKNGFDKTWHWYIKQEALKLQVRNQLIFQQMQKELEEHSQGKGKHRQKSRYQLFQYHKKKLDRMNDTAINQAYLVALQRNGQLNQLELVA